MRFGPVVVWLFILALLAICGTTIHASDQGDMERHRSCSVCGMDRKAYGYSRMLVVYEDNGQVGTCSLHCSVRVLQDHKERAVKELFVADRDSRVLINSEKATWVMGGRKRGVMTKNPKWAFAAETAAQAFIDANGGRIVTWNEALAAAREETAGAMH